MPSRVIASSERRAAASPADFSKWSANSSANASNSASLNGGGVWASTAPRARQRPYPAGVARPRRRREPGNRCNGPSRCGGTSRVMVIGGPFFSRLPRDALPAGLILPRRRRGSNPPSPHAPSGRTPASAGVTAARGSSPAQPGDYGDGRRHEQGREQNDRRQEQGIAAWRRRRPRCGRGRSRGDVRAGGVDVVAGHEHRSAARALNPAPEQDARRGPAEPAFRTSNAYIHQALGGGRTGRRSRGRGAGFPRLALIGSPIIRRRVLDFGPRRPVMPHASGAAQEYSRQGGAGRAEPGRERRPREPIAMSLDRESPERQFLRRLQDGDGETWEAFLGKACPRAEQVLRRYGGGSRRDPRRRGESAIASGVGGLLAAFREGRVTAADFPGLDNLVNYFIGIVLNKYRKRLRKQRPERAAAWERDGAGREPVDEAAPPPDEVALGGLRRVLPPKPGRPSGRPAPFGTRLHHAPIPDRPAPHPGGDGRKARTVPCHRQTETIVGRSDAPGTPGSPLTCPFGRARLGRAGTFWRFS